MSVRIDEQISAQLVTADATLPLGVVGGQIELDSAWSPYAVATLQIGLPGPDTWKALDPRTDTPPRVQIHHQVDGSARDYDLVLRSRQLDYLGGAQITAATDECLLQDLSNATPSVDTSARAHQASLRDLINSWLLPKIGATLEPGSTDADVTTTEELVNLVQDPNGTSTGHFVGVGATLSTQTSVGDPTPSLAATPTVVAPIGGACYVWFDAGTAASVTPGETYTIRLDARNGVAGQKIAPFMRFFDSAGISLTPNLNGTTYTSVSGGGWFPVTMSADAPPTAATVRVGVFIAATAASGTYAFELDNMMLVEGQHETDGSPVKFFSGDTPANAYYSYEWTGDKNASTSRRVPIIDRDPDSLAWQPGASLWALISPVIAAAGMRLFCDEQRKWRLIGTDYTEPGTLTVSQSSNLVDGSDVIDLADDDGWFDAVVVKYSWTDRNGAQQIRYDVAGNAGSARALLITENRPYPGPGLAAYVLKRQAAKGHQLSPSAVTDVLAKPYNPITVLGPNTPILTGLVSAITFDLAADTMAITTVGLTDTPPNAIVLGSDGHQIASVPAGHPIDTADWSTL